ncbi:MAG: dockerin type I domain-containing protein [Clostridiales bacterium]|nr:dockerin type I domain-containing protein [Clostridiales bacterium]
MTKRKILSTILVIAMIVTLIPAIASAQITEVKLPPSYFELLSNWKISPSSPGHSVLTDLGLDDDADIIEPDYDTSDWIDAVAPSTVLGNLIDAGVYDDFFMDRNGTTDEWFNRQFTAIPASDFQGPSGSLITGNARWWYSTDVEIPASEAGKKVTLSIGGMSYEGDLYVNGERVYNTYTNITEKEQLWNAPIWSPGAAGWTYNTPVNITNTGNAWSQQWGSQDIEAYQDLIVGSFRRFDVDVTDYIVPGKVNNIKFKILRPQSQQDLTYHWVDWHPRPVDSMMGLTGEVWISTSGTVRLNNPAVATKVSEDLSLASLNLYCDATNLTDANVAGTARAVVKDPQGNTVADVSKAVTIPSGKYNQEIAFSYNDFDALKLSDPQLWWLFTMNNQAKQALYTVDWSFAVGSAVSDSLTHRAGLRQIDCDINISSIAARNANTVAANHGANMMQVYVNHQPVVLRGGGYCPTDLFLRHNDWQNQGVVDNCQYAGFNMFRDEGKFFDNNLLDLCDEAGIFVMTGWCCCDRHQSPNAWSKCERFLGYEEQYAQIKNLRQHACGGLWYNGSDQPASYSQSSCSNSWMVEEMYHAIEADARWYEIGLTATSGCLDRSYLLGNINSGHHMDSSYNNNSPVYMFSPAGAQSGGEGPFGFISEGLGGAALPSIEVIKKIVPAANLYPYNNNSNYTVWNLHNSNGGTFGTHQAIVTMAENTYGASPTLESYLAKMDAMAFDQYRAQYESWNYYKYTQKTGLVNWMLNFARPGMYWQLFDWYMNPIAATYGAAKANEPVHIMYNLYDHDISVINSTLDAYPGLTATASIYSLDGKLINDPLVAKLDVAPDGASDVVPYGTMSLTQRRNGLALDDNGNYVPFTYKYGGKIEESYGVNTLWGYDDIEASLNEAVSDVYFIRLELTDSTGEFVSINTYAVAHRCDITTTTTWNTGQGFQEADFTSLNSLPAVDLKCVQTGSATANGIVTQTVEVTNNSDTIAHNVKLSAYTDNARTDLIGAVQYTDNIFVLLPGEARTIEVTHRTVNLAGNAVITASCYNNDITVGEKPTRIKNLYTGVDIGGSRSLSKNRTVTGSGGGTPGNVTAVAAAQETNAINGKTFIDSNISSIYTPTYNNGSAWFYIDLGASKAFDQIMARWNGGSTTSNNVRGRPDIVTISGSNNASGPWTELAKVDNTGSSSIMNNIVLDKTATYRYVRADLSGGIGAYNISAFDVYAFNNYVNVSVSGDGVVTSGGKTIDKSTYANRKVLSVAPDGSVELTFAPDALSPMVRVLADGVDVSDQLVDKGDTKALALSGLSGDVDLDVYFGIQAFLTTGNVTYINDDAEYTLSLMNAKDVLAVEAEFTIDGSMLAGKGLVGLNGFDSMNGVLWLHAGDNLWKGAVTLALPSGNSTGLTTDAPVDIAKFTYTAKGYGNAAMTLTSARVVFLDGTTKYIGSKIENGTATTIVARSKYDLNRDGVVDALDLGIMLLYCGFDADSPNWGTMVKVNDAWGNPVTAKMCDVNADGMIDMLDLLDLFIHYTK